MNKETIFSPCRKWRYTLWREWDCDLLTGCGDDAIHASSYLMVIGLNPSTADETKDDPTIRRCIGFAKRWGFGALCMTNLFAWRDTLPANMKKAENPSGEANQHHLLKNAAAAGCVLAAWGKHGAHMSMNLTASQWIQSIGVKLHCLGYNADGSPKHPLYRPGDSPLLPWPKLRSPAARTAAPEQAAG